MYHQVMQIDRNLKKSASLSRLNTLTGKLCESTLNQPFRFVGDSFRGSHVRRIIRQLGGDDWGGVHCPSKASKEWGWWGSNMQNGTYPTQTQLTVQQQRRGLLKMAVVSAFLKGCNCSEDFWEILLSHLLIMTSVALSLQKTISSTSPVMYFPQAIPLN